MTDKAQFKIYINKDLCDKIKFEAVRRGVRYSALIEEIIREFLKKNKLVGDVEIGEYNE